MTDYVVEEWTLDGTLNDLAEIHNSMQDRQFAFILGAGASLDSGIPSAKELAQNWLRQLHRRECNDDTELEAWASSPAVGITDLTFQTAAEHYPSIFERRFKHDPEAGYAALERAMERKSPSLGYSMLAEIIENTRHKVVITTNFDNLVADALAMHAYQSPLVVAHESLTGFVRPQLRRPLIAKIHRDLFLEPINDQAGVSTLGKQWSSALSKLFQYFTPIVIGYGGNDGSLMGLLESLPAGAVSGRMIWCYRGTRPNAKVLSVLKKHHGVLVQCPSFDDFMLRLAEKLINDFDVALIAERIEKLGKDRSRQCQEQALRLQSESARGAPEQYKTGEVINRSAESGKTWWSWELKARAEPDKDLRKKIFTEGLEHFPRSARLTASYANFLTDIHKEHDEAEALYQKAIALDPIDEWVYGCYANFLTSIRKNHDEADALYQKAIVLNPDNATITGNYASFLTTIRKNHNEAEALYQKSIALDPDNAIRTGNYANFLTHIRKNHDEADALYQKSIALDPNNATRTGNYARFLTTIRKNHDKAEALYQKAIALDPNNATNIGNYANFLVSIRKNHDEAEALYQKAITLDPDHALNTSNYASFLTDIRKNHDKAKLLYQKAIGLKPGDSNIIANYASLLLATKAGAAEEIISLVRQVSELSSSEPSQTLAEALLYGSLSSELINSEPGTYLSRLKGLFEIGFARGDWDFTPVFEAVLPTLTQERQTLYRALGEAILDADKLSALNDIPLWRDTVAADPYTD